jgi:prepilin-type N-terminal cleavage/methylation domain-containing protein
MKRAESGFTLIELMIVVAIISIIAAIAIPSLMVSLASGREAAAIGSLRTISTAAEQFRMRNSQYPVDLGDLSSQFPALIDEALGAGQRNGYNFDLEATPGGFACNADPELSPDARFFYLDHSGVIRQSSGSQAGPASAPVQ